MRIHSAIRAGTTAAAVLSVWLASCGAVVAGSASKAATGQWISFTLKNVELLTVIEVLVFERGLNIVAPPQLDRRVTVRLDRVPWREALSVILRQHGYGYEQVGNIIRIDTLERLARSPVKAEYQIRHLERTEVESLCRSVITTPGAYQVVEQPLPGAVQPETMLLVTAPAPDQERLKGLLARFDRARGDGLVTVARDRESATVTIEFDDLPVASVMEAVARELRLNLVWEVRPRGRATAHLRQLPLATALDLILGPAGYQFDLSGTVLRIGEKARFQSQLETRVFTLRHANALHVKALVVPHLSRDGKVEILGEARDAAGAGRAQTVTTAQPASTTSLAPGRTGGRSRATAELARSTPPSSVLMVIDTPRVLARVAQLVDEVDRPSQQIDIETRLVELTLTRETNLGIRWNVELSASGAAGPKVRFPFSRDDTPTTTSSAGFTLGTLSATNFSLLLRALSAKNQARVLSAPRVSTVSHEAARILIGQRFPITVESLDRQTALRTVTLDYFEDIGIVLTVTPRVTGKDMINLVVRPQVSSIASLLDNRFPVIDTREAETQLVVKSGHTAVIGGLLQDRSEKDEQGLPGLAHLKVLGRLFGGHRDTKRKTELLVCVTPTILSAAAYAPGPTPR
jgi:type II secretory pathway component GspD/PulD (secretin)